MIIEKYELVIVIRKLEKLLLASFSKEEIINEYTKLLGKNKKEHLKIYRHIHMIDIIKDSKNEENETKFML